MCKPHCPECCRVRGTTLDRKLFSGLSVSGNEIKKSKETTRVEKWIALLIAAAPQLSLLLIDQL
jgi:hypothetical protein